MPNFLVLDYETRSKVDLKKVGAYEYARHVSTNILCVSWRFGDYDHLASARTQVWSPAFPSPYGELSRALRDQDVKIVAHNSFFEQCITRFVLTKLIHRWELKEIPISQWICTQSLACAHSLPRDLDTVCRVLGLKHQKDEIGHKLMLKMSKPRKPTKHNPAVWHQNMADLKRLMQYCKSDVDATTELFLKLPDLIPQERRVWELDQEINWRGFPVDRERILKAIEIIDHEVEALDKETQELTDGKIKSTRQRGVLKDYVEKRGCMLPNMQAETIKDMLKSEEVDDDLSRRLLEIRLNASKSSNAKYPKFDLQSRTDGRVRDMILYHGAGTGRFTGRNIQPHNFPRGTFKNAIQITEDLPDLDADDLRVLYGDPLDVLSSCLRPMIIASGGGNLLCGDWSAVEVGVLFWLARHFKGLETIRLKGPSFLYLEMASLLYNIEISQINPDQRYIGKRIILGCGYQMGAPKFVTTCRKEGAEISNALGKLGVDTYRREHHPVKTFWGHAEKAVKQAISRPGIVTRVGYLHWKVVDDFLYCYLPSGRKIAYYKPHLRSKMMPWGEKKMSIAYWSMNSETRKWGREYTYGGKLVENATQAVARDIMVESMLRVEDKGYPVLITIHDEVLADKGKGNLKEFLNLMSVVPDWAPGCPVRVEGWEGKRYKKG